jgi:hypothetical protein
MPHCGTTTSIHSQDTFFSKAALGRHNRSEAAPFVFKLNPKVFVRVRFEHRSPSREIRDFLRSP